MEKLFKLKENGTTVRTEIIAGLTTFFAMAYIIFTTPAMLGDGTAAAMPSTAIMTATCIAAAIGTWLTAALTNYPLAQAPGVGLTAVFAYTLCGSLGLSFQAALAVVFVSGLFFILLTVTGARKALIDAIPPSMKKAIAAGIGFFIAMLGLDNAGLLSSETGTIIGLGSLTTPTTLLAILGLILTIVLVVANVKGGLFLSIIGTSVVACIVQFGFGIDMGLTLPSSWVPTLDFSLFGAAFSGFDDLLTLNTSVVALVSALISLLLVDMFDTVGTLLAAADKAGYIDKNGNMPKMGRAMLADAIATSVGSVFGTPTVTTYVESNTGISAGGRTGLASVVTGICFALSIFLSPVLGFIPAAATAPVLIIVGMMISSSLKGIKWDDLEDAIPAFMTVIGMPVFYSITEGIGFGFISFVIVKLAAGKWKQVHPLMYLLAGLFILKYVLGALA